MAFGEDLASFPSFLSVFRLPLARAIKLPEASTLHRVVSEPCRLATVQPATTVNSLTLIDFEKI